MTDTDILDWLEKNGELTPSVHPDHPEQLLFHVFLKPLPGMLQCWEDIVAEATKDEDYGKQLFRRVLVAQ